MWIRLSGYYLCSSRPLQNIGHDSLIRHKRLYRPSPGASDWRAGR